MSVEQRGARREPADTVESEPKEDAPARPFDAWAHIQSSAEEPRSLKSLPRLYLQAVRMAREASRRVFRVFVALQLLMAALLAVQVLLGKLALEAILGAAGQGGSLGAALPPLVGLVAAVAVGTLASSTQAQLQRLLGERVQRLTWQGILDVTTTVPLETFESPQFFDDLQRVKANALLRPLTLAQGLVALVGGALGVVGLSVALVAIEPILLPILLLGGVPLWLLSRRQGRLQFDFMVRVTPQLRLRLYLTELLCGRDEAKEIRAFGLAGVLRGRWDGNYREYLGSLRDHTRRMLWVAGLGALVTTVVTSASLGLLVWLILEQRLALATAGAGLIAIRLLATQIQNVFRGVSDLFESGLFLRDLDAFLRRARTFDAAAEPPAATARPFEELRVENVRFRYPGTKRDVLNGVSLTLRSGEVVALVGENGSGKTTLAKLLAQLFDPTDGHILWDGVDCRTLPREELRRHIGVIFQDFVRYQLTARENVGFGRAEAVDDIDAIREAARRGGADRYLTDLPEGYESGLGKEFFGGYDLSLGQWQRVALSRAFFRDAAFLLLDEPAASLDARSENRLFEDVRALAAGRSVLLISHRFSTVKSADRIYVMHEGEITEEGTHDELMAVGGRYAELFDLQARAFR